MIILIYLAVLINLCVLVRELARYKFYRELLELRDKERERLKNLEYSLSKRVRDYTLYLGERSTYEEFVRPK